MLSIPHVDDDMQYAPLLLLLRSVDFSGRSLQKKEMEVGLDRFDQGYLFKALEGIDSSLIEIFWILFCKNLDQTGKLAREPTLLHRFFGSH